jgi:NADH-quinone oxidoreductase subunit H
MFDQGWWGLLWFTLKMWMFIFFYVWLRGSLPRVRYDQFMKLGWKILIPLSLAWVIAVMMIRAAQEGYFGEGRWVLVATLAVVGLFVLLGILVWDRWAQGRAVEREERMAVPEEVDPFADGYPVPPLPGQKLVEPRRAVAAAQPVPARSVAPETDTTPEDRRG